MTRDERQLECVEQFKKARGIGTIEATPAFGKTRVAMLILRSYLSFAPGRTALVVVPQRYLKEQWEGLIDVEGFKDVTVEVINTAVKTKRNVDLMILDEIHRYAADTFQEVFDAVSYRHILGLTATIKRLDRKHTILNAYCPVIDRVSVTEARENGWIAEYMEFNLGVRLDKVQALAYANVEESYEKAMGVFMWSFKELQACAMSYRPWTNAEGTHDSACSRLAKSYGWRGKTPTEAAEALRKKTRLSNIWGDNLSHPYHPHRIYITALNGLRSISKMKQYMYSNPEKIVTAINLIKTLNVPTIVFGERIASADDLVKKLKEEGIPAISYHSGNKKLRKEGTDIKEQLTRGDIKVICTAKTLDERADFPTIRMGIRIAGTSSPTQHVQRRGRIIRKHEEKKAVMINLYLHGTKEVAWLSKAQGYESEVVWVDSVEEILEQINL